jgi:hypothetical protein
MNKKITQNQNITLKIKPASNNNYKNTLYPLVLSAAAGTQIGLVIGGGIALPLCFLYGPSAFIYTPAIISVSATAYLWTVTETFSHYASPAQSTVPHKIKF